MKKQLPLFDITQFDDEDAVRRKRFLNRQITKLNEMEKELHYSVTM